MPNDPPRPTAPPSPALDRDLYCLTCGYNLRGLSGDPVRCPECGNLNPIGDAEIPAELISRQLRRMRTLPALCVLVVLLGLPLPALLGWALWTGSPSAPARVGTLLCCPGVLSVGALVLWGVLVASFRNSCQGRPGWWVALAKYHLYSLFWLSLLGGLIGAAGWVAWQFLGQRIGGVEFAVLLIGGVGVLGLTVIGRVQNPLRKSRRRLSATLGALQRQVAIDTARRELQHKLARPHKGFFD